MKVFASDFAGQDDVAAYKAAIARGLSPQEALAKGDNGVGCWGDDTTTEDVAICALPPDDYLARWGKGTVARNKRVLVVDLLTGQPALCLLRDRMPWKRDITNGCGSISTLARSRSSISSVPSSAPWPGSGGMT